MSKDSNQSLPSVKEWVSDDEILEAAEKETKPVEKESAEFIAPRTEPVQSNAEPLAVEPPVVRKEERRAPAETAPSSVFYHRREPEVQTHSHGQHRRVEDMRERERKARMQIVERRAERRRKIYRTLRIIGMATRPVVFIGVGALIFFLFIGGDFLTVIPVLEVEIGDTSRAVIGLSFVLLLLARVLKRLEEHAYEKWGLVGLGLVLVTGVVAIFFPSDFELLRIIFQDYSLIFFLGE